jgi:hypothetical protein
VSDLNKDLDQAGGRGEEVQFKRPDFVVIDDRNKKTSHQGEEIPHVENFQTANPPYSLRFICFLGVIFCAIFGLGLTLLNLIVTFFAFILLLQNRELNETAISLWKLWKNTWVGGFCCLLGIVFPKLGIGLLTLYFTFTKDRSGINILQSIFKNPQ